MKLFNINNTKLDFEIQRSALKIHINLKKGELNDKLNLMRDVRGIGHYGSGDYEILVKDMGNFDYIVGLIRQSYDKQMN